MASAVASSGGWSVGNWIGLGALLLTAIGLIGAILQAAKSAVTSNVTVAESIKSLTATVTRVEDEVKVYIETDRSREHTMSDWQRLVDSRLSGIETRLDVFQIDRRKPNRARAGD